MRQRTAIWFECKIRYEKVSEEGLKKKVTEQYVVDAMSFSEAEKCIMEEMSIYINGEFEVTDVKKATYNDVLFGNDDMVSQWFKAKLQFITIDEKFGKEKRSNIYYLVQAASFDKAVKNISDMMNGTMIDYEKSNICKTKIIDVFEFRKEDTDGEDKD